MGYATIGRIGFEGRFDYAAIGTVTNLSARLCQEAGDGQILVSQQVHAEIEPLVEAKPVGPLALRGFARPVAVYDILGLRAEPTTPAGRRATPWGTGWHPPRAWWSWRWRRCAWRPRCPPRGAWRRS
jgi:class 3 adenylate cyclase